MEVSIISSIFGCLYVVKVSHSEVPNEFIYTHKKSEWIGWDGGCKVKSLT